MQIGEDLNKNVPNGPRYISAEGGAVILDGMELKNVVFSNTQIVYNGGPLRMTDVYFLNCTFAMRQNHNAQNLAAAILSPSASTAFTGM